MKLRTPIIWGAAGLIIALLSGCGASGTSLGKSNQRPYDFEAHILHPRCAVLPAGIDSVDVYLDWSREEALFLRDSPQSPFTANLQLKAGTFEVTWSDTLVDFAPGGTGNNGASRSRNLPPHGTNQPTSFRCSWMICTEMPPPHGVYRCRSRAFPERRSTAMDGLCTTDLP